MSEGHADAPFDEPRQEVHPALDFGSQRDDGDVRHVRIDDILDIERRKVLGLATIARRAWRACFHRMSKAGERLRAAVIGIDEITLEVRRQYPGCADRPRHPRGGDLLEGGPQFSRAAGHRCRAERRHPVPRQPRRDR